MSFESPTSKIDSKMIKFLPTLYELGIYSIIISSTIGKNDKITYFIDFLTVSIVKTSDLSQ